jgi:hypothetical protein
MGQGDLRQAEPRMSFTLSLTETQIMTAVRSVLVAILPDGIEVFRGQTNRVPEPTALDFVVFTPIMRDRMSEVSTKVSDTFPTAQSTRADKTSTRATIQIDIHGPAGADNAALLAIGLRAVGNDLFQNTGFDVGFLWLGDAHQEPFVNAEAQIETRWVMDLAVQCNQTVTSPQEFATSVSVGVVNVDATFPPGP